MSRDPGSPHVDAVAAEGHAFLVEQRALTGALGQRAVGAHDPPPWHVLLRGREDGAGEARRARGHVAIGPHEALGHLADPSQHVGRPIVPHMRHGTYSIVARDPETGELGVAVQSHWFSVGPLCAWARAGVGAVATQSVVEPAYGPNALDRLA